MEKFNESINKSRKALSPIIERNRLLNAARALPIEEKVEFIKIKYGLTHGNSKKKNKTKKG